ncbi:hypothetical protein BAE44_0012702 [Dichanthelium oligosanthes]|uniref:MADS-box domain-containing protein n=1 Tax=Dichanthelium oligosanthes TaxID=888268 RepID=A0A1E5VMC4_9POAL|nr:hypothetical protein BAE44_0012702 [Dichanthelium oligosanthes]
MGRRKVSMGLIPNRRVRVNTFGKRKEGLKKKAGELSVLCGVDVALVVAAADGGDGGAGAADVWESKEGVLARYRALDPEVRARHTHRAYLQGELGKGEAKLARVRQGGPHGLDRWDKALDGVATAEEAQQLIDAVDAVIRATDDRKKTLGLPIDDEDGGAGVVLEGIAPLSFAGVDDYLLHAPGGDTNDQAMWGGYGGFQFQQGSAASMQQAGYGFQPCASSGGGAGMESYHLQMAPDMYGNSDNNNGHLALADAYQQYQPRDAGTMPHGYGFPCAHASYFGLPSGYQMQQQVLPQPDLSMWCADEPRHDMLPLEYPSTDTGLSYADTPAAHGGQGIGGRPFAGNFINSPPALSLAMGTGGGGGNFINASPAGPSYTMGATSDNFTNATAAQPLAISYGGDLTIAGSRYATQWQAAPQPQHAGSDQKPGIEHLH